MKYLKATDRPVLAEPGPTQRGPSLTTESLEYRQCGPFIRGAVRMSKLIAEPAVRML
jgi:hypothetical protein